MKWKNNGSRRTRFAWRNLNSRFNKNSAIAGSWSRNSANFDRGIAMADHVPILGSLAHHYKQYHEYKLCSKQKIMLGAGCSLSGRYPSPVKVSEHASSSEIYQISESFRRLCSIFWVLAKGFKWPRGEVTREISFELGRFGTALETARFSRRLKHCTEFLGVLWSYSPSTFLLPDIG